MKTQKVIGLMFMCLMLVMLSGCGDDKYVQSVKNGSMQMEPNVKIGVAFGNFFSDTDWKSFESKDGQRVVEFNGKCTWENKPAKCRVQFVFNGENSFELGAVSINDVSMNRIQSLAIIKKALQAQ